MIEIILQNLQKNFMINTVQLIVIKNKNIKNVIYMMEPEKMITW